MSNPQGTPIWYELLTTDHAASKKFYDAVVGWTIEPQASNPMDYRMIAAGDGFAGGVMQITDQMAEHGARPTWLMYVGVDDVDATLERLTAAGGTVTMPAFDVPDVGRMALVADPQGVPFYVMRGASDQDSNAFSSTAIGRCSWNELVTSDQGGAIDFYTKLFGWTVAGSMPMGEMGDYIFLTLGEARLGAVMTAPAGHPPMWKYYFRVADVDASGAAITAGGGTILHGPIEVPGGDRVILASDPMGAAFGVVG